jgi:serine protease AprX
MKNWLKLATGAVMLTAVTAHAQTAEQRKAVQQVAETTELGALAEKFQAQFEAEEAKVQHYLRDNPGVSRQQVKNGVSHYLLRIDSEGAPVYRVGRGEPSSGKVGQKSNRESGQLIKADSLYPGGSLGVSVTGSGMIAGVWEPSAVAVDGTGAVTHELLVGKVTNQAGQVVSAKPGDSNHAAHVSGTMVGRDLASRPSVRGIAYNATARVWDAPNDLTEMTGFAAAGYLISNHSYGDANTQTANLALYGAYDAEARDWDAMLKAAPNYLPFVAAGNEQQNSGNRAPKLGYDIMTGPSNSKNAMAVGAVNADKTMSTYSNWGPTDDGRVKPEIVARGTAIDSAQASDATTGALTNAGYSGSVDDSSGTSYSSPAAAAGGLLLQEYYQNVTGVFMRSSTLKALMLGTAEDLGRPGPDHQFGWGLLNVEKAALAIKNRSATGATLATSKGSVVEEIPANPAADSTAEITRTVFAKGGEPLVVNIAWIDDAGPLQTDAEGIDPVKSRMVYDFDVMVRQVGGGERWGWVVPGMSNRLENATTATGWFEANGGNFKQVLIANPVVNAEYTIAIRKKTGSPAEARSISLVVTGLAQTTSTATSVEVVEYFIIPANKYFISGRSLEIAALDGAPTVFRRTGARFTAFAAAGAPAGTESICRFFLPTAKGGPNSHFYGRPADCELIRGTKNPVFDYEGEDFAVQIPVAGVCPASAPNVVYRAFNNRAAQNDGNHRYTNTLARYNEMIAKGFVGEGPVFCVATATDGTE